MTGSSLQADQDRRSLSAYQRRRKVMIAILIVGASPIVAGTQSALHTDLSSLIQALGILLVCIGLLGRLWATMYIGGRKAAEIVDNGPYSISRNPLYLFSSIAVAGVGAQSGSVTVSAVLLLFSVIAFGIVIRREERFLASIFGTGYETYLRRVPRILPNFRLFHDAPAVSVVPKRLYSTLLDGLGFVLAIPLFEIAERLRAAGAIPILLNLL